MALHKLPESELKVMDFIWSQGETTARDAANYMDQAYGWKKNTTYTVLKNLGKKGFLERREPGFICVPLIEQEKVAKQEAHTLLEKFYHGSVSGLFSAFLNENVVSEAELKELKEMLDRY